ncbi:hypothetical protein PAMC26510_28895 [Caballeronia sordidicola]|uniref:Uncharacterized protein n=1 Tax=Caballeronia sordidicola TaxID=196367 RepID=A0A242MBK4_CABSO|nr:hypothetical protein PAMC26510_28895 [Caballeronia sordidicola]
MGEVPCFCNDRAKYFVTHFLNKSFFSLANFNINFDLII